MGTEAERWLKGYLPAQSLWFSPGDWITGSHFIHFCHFSISFTVFPQTEKKNPKNHTQYFFLSFLINSPPQTGLERMLVRNSWVSCNETCWVIYQIRGKPSTGQQEGRARGLVRQWGWASRHSTRAGNLSWVGGGGHAIRTEVKTKSQSKSGSSQGVVPKGMCQDVGKASKCPCWGQCSRFQWVQGNKGKRDFRKWCLVSVMGWKPMQVVKTPGTSFRTFLKRYSQPDCSHDGTRRTRGSMLLPQQERLCRADADGTGQGWASGFNLPASSDLWLVPPWTLALRKVLRLSLGLGGTTETMISDVSQGPGESAVNQVPWFQQLILLR